LRETFCYYESLLIYDARNSLGATDPVSSEAPRPQAGASRIGNIVLIVPLNPAYKAGLAGHFPVIEYQMVFQYHIIVLTGGYSRLAPYFI